ncbi:nickel pincer cofactor biosynthesis protein LarC [Nakamurella lactea]|uniref:nickel pincer cofactor biosynthesis protein LarC n=1 Tax=Nakamurella lactea TaxID=459515 RepID=UPI000412F106|nr:nickel pincer cofactor biosynthesis protein LarC [Nakamurella lactea]
MTADRRVLWLDATAGVAGDMLLAALVDLGVRLPGIQAAVDAVIPGTVLLRQREVSRAGLRALKVDVELVATDQHHRSWREIRNRIVAAELTEGARANALAAFGALAAAEGRVHGVAADDVHFHEVGAWDSIADLVGSCAALDSLGADRVTVSEIALGSGTVRAAHGVLPVPVPAVTELIAGWSVTSGGDGELATPTGVALLTTLAAGTGPLPAMTVQRVGVGAGSRDRPDRPNVVRAVLGTSAATAPAAGTTRLTMLETTVDDLDPRLWPSVLDALLAAGAADAWLTPVLMKKGRPGQVLSVLAEPALAPALQQIVLARTSTLGVRSFGVQRTALDRCYLDVELAGGTVAVKIGHRDGVVLHATAEYSDAAAAADATGRTVADVLAEAEAGARAAGVVPGAGLPPGVRN